LPFCKDFYRHTHTSEHYFSKMLSRQSRLLLRKTPTTLSSTGTVATRTKSTKSESNVVNFEAKARVKEHARRIGTSAKVGVEVAR
jgi:hypothetical protein